MYVCMYVCMYYYYYPARQRSGEVGYYFSPVNQCVPDSVGVCVSAQKLKNY